MELHIYKSPDEVCTALAEWMVSYIDHVLQSRDRFTIALSGGSTPKKLHQLLASAPYRQRVRWEKLHFFWGDERGVPFADERNNAKMAFDTLLDLVPVNKTQVHIMRTDIEPAAASHEYENILHQYFPQSGSSFDLVLLGMGDDGHTLSLFPGMDVVSETHAWVTSFYLAVQSMFRITLTFPIVNRSEAVVFLTTGKSKSNALREVLQGASDPTKYPSQLIRPSSGNLHWFVDEAAASELTGSPIR